MTGVIERFTKASLPTVVEPYYHSRYTGRKPHTDFPQRMTNTRVKLTDVAEFKKWTIRVFHKLYENVNIGIFVFTVRKQKKIQ